MTHGIPTTYAGIHFRSRAEARWAAFFDECEWSWQYEPVDLDGYIPDFLVEGVLVEVKGGVTDYYGMREISPTIHERVRVLLPAFPLFPQRAQLGSVRTRGGWEGLDFGACTCKDKGPAMVRATCPMWHCLFCDAEAYTCTRANSYASYLGCFSDDFSDHPDVIRAGGIVQTAKLAEFWQETEKVIRDGCKDRWARASNTTQWRPR